MAQKRGFDDPKAYELPLRFLPVPANPSKTTSILVSDNWAGNLVRSIAYGNPKSMIRSDLEIPLYPKIVDPSLLTAPTRAEVVSICHTSVVRYNEWLSAEAKASAFSVASSSP